MENEHWVWPNLEKEIREKGVGCTALLGCLAFQKFLPAADLLDKLFLKLFGTVAVGGRSVAWNGRKIKQKCSAYLIFRVTRKQVGWLTHMGEQHDPEAACKGYQVLSHQQAPRSNELIFSLTVPAICGLGILPATQEPERPRRGILNKLFKKKCILEFRLSPLSLYTSNTAAGYVAGKLRQETRVDARGLTSSRSDHFKLDPLDLESAVSRLSADHLSKRNNH